MANHNLIFDKIVRRRTKYISCGEDGATSSAGASAYANILSTGHFIRVAGFSFMWDHQKSREVPLLSFGAFFQ